jgi:hypothetical protein
LPKKQQSGKVMESIIDSVFFVVYR